MATRRALSVSRKRRNRPERFPTSSNCDPCEEAMSHLPRLENKVPIKLWNHPAVACCFVSSVCATRPLTFLFSIIKGVTGRVSITPVWYHHCMFLHMFTAAARPDHPKSPLITPDHPPKILLITPSKTTVGGPGGGSKSAQGFDSPVSCAASRFAPLTEAEKVPGYGKEKEKVQ